MIQILAYRLLGLKFAWLYLFIASAAALAMNNITVSVPDGTSNHGDNNMLCTPTTWEDIVIFFLGNYVAHAATIKTVPGEGTVSIIFVTISALLIPASGVVRGALAIFSRAKLAKSDLQAAARASALCMVVRSADWRPMAGDTIGQCLFRSPAETAVATVSDRYAKAAHLRIYCTPWSSESFNHVGLKRKIHGVCQLPDGYHLVFVPGTAEFSSESSPNDLRLSASYSWVKIVVAIGQVLYAMSTLYQSRGDQITQYGYAAFGLTVVPYLVMSVVNLLGNLMVAEYPALYLVDSPVMQEARKREKCRIDGTVGSLLVDNDAELVIRRKGAKSIDKPLVFYENAEISGGLKFDLLTSIQERQSQTSPPPEASSGTSPPSLALLRAYTTSFSALSGRSLGDGHPVVLVPASPPFKRLLREDATKPGHYRVTGAGIDTNWVDEQDKGPSLWNKEMKLVGSDWHFVQVKRAMSFRFLVGACSIAIIGGLSLFHPGRSTIAERVWTMMWLSFGILFGDAIFPLSGREDASEIYSFATSAEKRKTIFTHKRSLRDICGEVLPWIICVMFYIPSIGGFVVVGEMLKAYGSCIELS